MDLYFEWAMQSRDARIHARKCLVDLQIRPEHQEKVLKDLLAFVERHYSGAATWGSGGRMMDKIVHQWVGEAKGGRTYWGPWRSMWCRDGDMRRRAERKCG